MNTTLDMERIAKELGAERRGKVSAHGDTLEHFS